MTSPHSASAKRRRLEMAETSDTALDPSKSTSPPQPSLIHPSSFPLPSSPPAWSYHNRLIAAPMVRLSTLPFRLLCRHHGADMLYSEELIAAKLHTCTRSVDPLTSIVHFTAPSSSSSPTFSTYPGEPVVVQLGTNNPSDALLAALVVAGDVRGVDVNMGCPVRFSTQGGMGSALLSQPELAHSILSTLRRNLPASIAVTCKVRLLPSLPATLHFLHACQSAGIDAIAVHARHVPDRPRHPALPHSIPFLASQLTIPLLYNGDVFTRDDIQQQAPLASSLMLARGAQWNASLFSEQPLPVFDIVRQYLGTARVYGPAVSNGKYCAMEMLKGHVGGLKAYRGVIQAKSWDDLDAAVAEVREEVELSVAAGVERATTPSMRERLAREVERHRRLLVGPYEPPAVAWEERPQSKPALSDERKEPEPHEAPAQAQSVTATEYG